MNDLINSIINIIKVIKSVLININKEEYYYLIEEYDDNLQLTFSRDHLCIFNKDNTIAIIYFNWHRDIDPDLRIVLKPDCAEKLKDFAESLTKHQDDIIKDIQKLNG